MRKCLLVMLAAAVSCCFTLAAVAETGEQVTKDQNIAKTARKRSTSEKMMPEPEVQLKRLTKGLKLSDGQQNQIRPMLQDEYVKLKEIRKDDDLSPKQIRIKVETLRTETIAKIQTVLTPEQIEKHNLVSSEIRANKQKRIQENRRNRLGTNSDPPTK